MQLEEMDCEKQRLASGDCGGNIGFMKAVEQLTPRMTLRKRKWMHVSQTIPQTSMERMQQTVDEKPYDLEHITSLSKDTKETVLYLGYGSNLAAETFLGRRGIRPLSQVNVVAPAIRLTFDLPGIPYSEPCFANSKYRPQPGDPPEAERPPYHKNAWKKGLVGVVYEVTKKDYVHIIATEGGGSGYHDVLVDCFVLDDDPDVEVPMKPTGTAFKAHTLYAHTGERLRPNPDYAQPSPRYLKLITDGADEHNLPTEYRKFLANIRTYHATTTQQSLGSFVYLAVWGPIFAFVFGVAPKIFLRKDGTYPDWFKRLTAAIFVACWASYDQFFFALFGDGERTIGDNVVAHKGEHRTLEWPSEKTPLLPR